MERHHFQADETNILREPLVRANLEFFRRRGISPSDTLVLSLSGGNGIGILKAQRQRCLYHAANIVGFLTLMSVRELSNLYPTGNLLLNIYAAHCL